MVQVIEQDDGIFGRLGRGFGQSLAEQVPKAVERRILASGLQNFQKNAKNLTPIEQAIQLYQIPGFTPEMGYTLSPLLQKQQGREALQKRASGGSETVSSQGQKSGKKVDIPMERGEVPSRIKGNETIDITENIDENIGFKTPSSSVSQRNTPYVPTTQDLDNLAFDLSEQNPGLSEQEAKQQAAQMLNLKSEQSRAEIETASRQDQALQNVLSKFQNKLTKKIGGAKGQTSTALPNEFQEKLENQMLREMNNPRNKLSEDQIIDKYAQEGESAARALSSINEVYDSNYPFTGAGTGEIKERIGSAQEIFDKYGALPQFRDYISSKTGMSPAAASLLAYPRTLKLDSKIPESPITDPKIRYKKQQKIINKMARDIQPDQSLLATAQLLRGKGYDGNEFLSVVRDLYKDGKISLSQSQQNEKNQGLSSVPNLTDIWYFSVWDLKNPKKVKK